MDYLSCIANVCTILGFGIACRVWYTWKKQQNYSFTRDKIFDLEFSTSSIYSVFIEMIISYTRVKVGYLQDDIRYDPLYHSAIERKIINLKEKLDVYERGLVNLKLLELKYRESELPSKDEVDIFFKKCTDSLNHCKTKEDLVNIN